MTQKGFESSTKRTPTTGLETIIIDGIKINSPEAVVEHIEKFEIPACIKAIKEFDEEKTVVDIIKQEESIQRKLGPDILKSGYGYIRFPGLAYTYYGYSNYLMAYALYPDVMEKLFLSRRTMRISIIWLLSEQSSKENFLFCIALTMIWLIQEDYL